MQRRAPVPAGLELAHDLRELAVRARRIDDLRQPPPVGRHLRHALAHRGRPRLGLGRRRAGDRSRLRRTSRVKLCPGVALSARGKPRCCNTAVAAYRHMYAIESGLLVSAWSQNSCTCAVRVRCAGRRAHRCGQGLAPGQRGAQQAQRLACASRALQQRVLALRGMAAERAAVAWVAGRT
jgi:hypothetical protein